MTLGILKDLKLDQKELSVGFTTTLNELYELASDSSN